MTHETIFCREGAYCPPDVWDKLHGSSHQLELCNTKYPKSTAYITLLYTLVYKRIQSFPMHYCNLVSMVIALLRIARMSWAKYELGEGCLFPLILQLLLPDNKLGVQTACPIFPPFPHSSTYNTGVKEELPSRSHHIFFLFICTTHSATEMVKKPERFVCLCVCVCVCVCILQEQRKRVLHAFKLLNEKGQCGLKKKVPFPNEGSIQQPPRFRTNKYVRHELINHEAEVGN